MEQAREGIARRVGYKECDENIPDRGIGEIVAVGTQYVFVKWEKLVNACLPQNLFFAETKQEEIRW